MKFYRITQEHQFILQSDSAIRKCYLMKTITGTRPVLRKNKRAQIKKM